MPDSVPNVRAGSDPQDAGQEAVLATLRRLVAARGPGGDTPRPAASPAGDGADVPTAPGAEPRTRASLPPGAAPLRLAQRAEALPLVLSHAQRVWPCDPAGAPGDEAALRALLARAVREELRGEAGAHLTRKLRRMVREEIALALQSHGGGR
ncbi:MAG: hypothetical protein ACXIUV_05040 [Alkalilacustris sp.]